MCAELTDFFNTYIVLNSLFTSFTRTQLRVTVYAIDIEEMSTPVKNHRMTWSDDSAGTLLDEYLARHAERAAAKVAAATVQKIGRVEAGSTVPLHNSESYRRRAASPTVRRRVSYGGLEAIPETEGRVEPTQMERTPHVENEPGTGDEGTTVETDGIREAGRGGNSPYQIPVSTDTMFGLGTRASGERMLAKNATSMALRLVGGKEALGRYYDFKSKPMHNVLAVVAWYVTVDDRKHVTDAYGKAAKAKGIKFAALWREAHEVLTIHESMLTDLTRIAIVFRREHAGLSSSTCQTRSILSR